MTIDVTPINLDTYDGLVGGVVVPCTGDVDNENEENQE